VAEGTHAALVAGRPGGLEEAFFAAVAAGDAAGMTAAGGVA
jgi:hypothetical protein